MPKDSVDSSSVLLGPTAVIFGVVTVAIYFLVIRPWMPSRPLAAAAAGTRQTTNTAAATDAANNNNTNSATFQQQQQQHNESTLCCTRVPPHVSDASAPLAINGGANLLSDGLVAFKHCRAAAAVATTSPEEEAHRRVARAKLLSALLRLPPGGGGATSTPPPPPAKGSAIVVTVPLDSARCPYQRRVLYLLATYYNLLVLLAVAPDVADTFTAADRRRAIASLRGEETVANAASGDDDCSSDDGGDRTQPTVVADVERQQLSAEILPTHRIVMASTVTGRVAFVRQLQRIELVLDFDLEVLGLLSRFGHRVIVYGDTKSRSSSQNEIGNPSVSKLGRVML